MASETVAIVLDAAWQLISNANTEPFSAEVLAGGQAQFFYGSVAPAADAEGLNLPTIPFAVLGASKVWAKAVAGTAQVRVLRTVDAGNLALPALSSAALADTDLSPTAVKGTIIKTLTDLLDGSTVAISPNDGRYAFVRTGATTGEIQRGLSSSSPNTKVEIVVLEAHPKVAGKPRRRGFTLTVTPEAGGGGFIAPLTNWRMPLTELGYDSGGSATFIQNARDSSAAKTEAYAVVAANSNRVYAQPVPAFASGTGILTFAAIGPAYSFTAEISTDSTNGQDGTWTALEAPVTYTNQSSPRAIRAIALIPPGPRRWVRLTLTNPNASGLGVYIKWYLKPATGITDTHLVIGASREYDGLGSRTIEAKIREAFPDRDPLVINYAASGKTAGEIDTVDDIGHDTFRRICDYCWIGNIIGGDVNTTRPLSGRTQTQKDNLSATIRSIITKAKAMNYRGIGMCSTSFRHYANALTPGTNEAEGSLPYNTEILFPLVKELLPDAWDSELQIPRVDHYNVVMRNRASLATDGIHGAYDVVNTHMVASWFTRIFTGVWPKAYVVSQVELAEASRAAIDKAEATYQVNSLPASAAKTSLQARLAAIVTT